MSLPNRQSIRLSGYNYSQNGLYFCTICVQHMGHIMGNVGVDPCVDPNNKTGAHMGATGAHMGATGAHMGATGAHMGATGAHMGAPLQMVLNDVGHMMEHWWNKIPEKFPGVELDEFQIMPNHLHGIINIVGADPRVRPHIDPCVRPHMGPCVHPVKPCVRPPTLGAIIQWFKTMTTNEYINHVKNDKWIPFPMRLWQRNYYEHIIRDETEYWKIKKYIQYNPQHWEIDENNKNVRAIHYAPQQK